MLADDKVSLIIHEQIIQLLAFDHEMAFGYPGATPSATKDYNRFFLHA